MFRFNKKEILKNKISIKNLFSYGTLIKEGNIHLIWIEKDNRSLSQILITVPKKHISAASKRNNIKRKLKEAIRISKHKLYNALEESNKFIDIAIIYNNQEIIPYNIIEEKINILLQRLINNL
jgi:ribonuclease P protein component